MKSKAKLRAQVKTQRGMLKAQGREIVRLRKTAELRGEQVREMDAEAFALAQELYILRDFVWRVAGWGSGVRSAEHDSLRYGARMALVGRDQTHWVRRGPK